MANPPPPYSDITGISRTVMKDNAQETLSNYNGNARPGEIVADLTQDPPSLYIGNNLGQLTSLSGSLGGYGNTEVAAFLTSGLVGNIIPSGNAVYSLGNLTNQWSDLYVSNATIYMNNVAIGLNSSNVLTVDGQNVVTTNPSGVANIANLSIQGTDIGTQSTNANIQITAARLTAVTAPCYIGLTPGLFIADIEFNDDITVVQAGWTVTVGETVYTVTSVEASPPAPANQFRITVPGATFTSGANYTFVNPVPVESSWTFGNSGQLTLPNGTTVVDSSDNNFEVRGMSNANFEATDNFNIYTDDGNNQWAFSNTGNLTFPEGSVYQGNVFVSPESTLSGSLNSFAWQFSDISVGSDTITLEWNLLDTTTAQWYFSTNSKSKFWLLDSDTQKLSFDATGGAPGLGGTLTFGTATNNNTGNINSIELTSPNSNVYVRANGNAWIFDNTGNVTVPGNVLGVLNEDVHLTTSSNIATSPPTAISHNFKFKANGTLGLPGAIEVPQDQDLNVNVSYYAMTSPPGVQTNTFSFKSDGQLEVPYFIGSSTGYLELEGLDQVSINSNAEIRIGYAASYPEQIYIGSRTANVGTPTDTRIQSDNLHILTVVPTTSKGKAGDSEGQIAIDSNYIYYCTGTYNGTDDIWKRVALTGGAW